MITDTVIWADGAAGCSRCGMPAKRYVSPFWSRPSRVCPTCCLELVTLFDRDGWPLTST